MRTHVSPSAGSTVVDKLKVYEGGTGQTDPSLALAAMDAIPASLINQPNGIAGLNSSGQFNTAQLPLDVVPTISLTGPTTLIKGGSYLFTLNNYDCFTDYTITATGGQAVQEVDGIRFVAGNTAGPASLTVNGRTVSLTISDYKPVTPTLAAVTTGGAGTTASLVATGSSFSMQGNSDTHLNTDWQIASDINFVTVVTQSLADATNKTSWTGLNLALSTTYYARCRYRSSGGFASDWSNTVTVTTKASYVTSIEEAIVRQSTYSSGNQFIAYISGDSQRVLIADPQDNTNKGCVYVFVRVNGVLTLEQKISAPATEVDASTSYGAFGSSAAITPDGSRMVIGAPNAKYGSNVQTGCVYVYTRNGSVWNLEQKIFASQYLNANSAWGIDCSMTRDGSRLTFSSYGINYTEVWIRTNDVWAKEAQIYESGVTGFRAKISGDGTRLVTGHQYYNGYDGSFSVWVRSGSTWTREYAAYGTSYDNFGGAIAIDIDATRVFVAGTRSYTNGNNNGVGYVSIYKRTNSSWALEAKITANGTTAANASWVFGGSVAVDTTGTYLFIGCPQDPVNTGISFYGSYYVFKRTNTTWTQVARVTPSIRQYFFGSYVSCDDTGFRALVSNSTYNASHALTYPPSVFSFTS